MSDPAARYCRQAMARRLEVTDRGVETMRKALGFRVVEDPRLVEGTFLVSYDPGALNRDGLAVYRDLIVSRLDRMENYFAARLPDPEEARRIALGQQALDALYPPKDKP